MKIHNGVQLSDVEYEELLTLAEAADNGEDVMLAAFMRLCPTGQEGAFDESIVAAYAALADLGFIEGVQEGGEFFFEDITPAGRSLTNPTFAAKFKQELEQMRKQEVQQPDNNLAFASEGRGIRPLVLWWNPTIARRLSSILRAG